MNIKHMICSATLTKFSTTDKVLQYLNTSTEYNTERALGLVNQIQSVL